LLVFIYSLLIYIDKFKNEARIMGTVVDYVNRTVLDPFTTYDHGVQ